MDILVPLVFVLPIALAAFALYVRQLPPDEGQRLFRIVVVALFIRLLVATMFALVPSTRLFHDDAEGYEGLGMALARGWHHEGPPLRFPDDINRGYYYMCGAIYYVFGQYRAGPSFVNAFIGCLTVLLVHRVASTFFHTLVARRAALYTAFIPSMILWNSVALKDTTMTFLIVVALYSCVRLKQRFTAGALLGTVLPLIAVQPIRFYMIYFLGFAIVTSLALERGFKTLTGVSKQVFIAGAAVGLLALVGFAGSAQAGMDMLSFERVSTFRQGMATTANSGFAAEVDVSTPGRALAFLPLGVTMLLFSPFPWQFTSLRASLTAPEMFLWWALVPALWRGLRYAVKHRFAECSPILIFAGILTGAYSLMHGNVGSGFRQRAQIFVFLFIFASLGIFIKRCRQRGLDPKILLNQTGGPR